MIPTVYCDELVSCIPNKNWRWNESAHLFVMPGDTVELTVRAITRLHAIAKNVGLKRAWFQVSGTMPHYDLTRRRQRAAQNYGAILVERQVAAFAIAAWRNWKANTPAHEIPVDLFRH